eukprot:CAMPEP_0194209154 /NCGR_PEP_ID=MMETSP0156-20130528/7379_1 /TAXON_ID=33649 /ORGANISM="Thalassionema nitzschioides, Strain L26-B" /LENGTH=892 /DNA_ID=CAMNT_0038936269 /DNA_START=132 /DNA_END=2810 /DNA_ORIENTATION=-
MKRALAHRAKHDPNGLKVTSPSSQPPLKIAKVEDNGDQSQQASIEDHEMPSGNRRVSQDASLSRVTTAKSIKNQNGSDSSNANKSSTNTKTGSNSGTNTPRGKTSMKRQRISQTAAVDDTGEKENSSFFLKHQNAALASELKQLNYQFDLLEKERNFRRNQCKDANQALHSLEATWTAMEVALQLGQQPPGDEGEGKKSVTADTPRSTGTGESVELIGALLDSLAAIAKDIKNEQKESSDEFYDLERITMLVSKRATALQRWIWGLLKKVTSEDESGKNPLLKLAKVEAKISTLKSQCREYEEQIGELSKCRDVAIASEKRVRRGLYRLSAGRMKLDEVMKAIESEDKDGPMSPLKLEELEIAPNAPIETPPVNDDGQVVNSDEAHKLQKQIRDLEEISSAKQKQIEQLSKEREANLKRINELVLNSEVKKSPSEKSVISEDDIKQSELFTDTWTRMKTAERQLLELQAKLAETKENWATAMGNAEHATKNFEDQLTKHRRRWAELSDVSGAENNEDDGICVNGETLAQAEKIAELEHKLKQALESVRRTDVIRASLEEASRVNEALQARLEEMKAKNLSLARNKQQIKSETPSSKESSSKQSDTPVGDKALLEKIQKLKKTAADYVSKDQNAKAKLEVSEKKRESLMKANSRLIKQSAEKDDMNAKSLSTILHLKSLTEKLNQEKELLGQQTKSAGQINVAVRLASNAKDRVTEDALNQRKLYEQKLLDLEEKCELLKVENDKALGNLSKKKAEMTDLEQDAATAKKRCDELVSESTKQQEEKRKILESLEVAKREAGDAAKKMAKMVTKGGGGDGGHSEFTKDQLATQISVLKGRLACPVCNHRDKNCIVTRCRHMFCKACVDEMIKNRNRKCPSCGQRFDNKDVEDIWL